MDPVTVIIRGKHDTGKTSLARLIENFLKETGYRHVEFEDTPPLPAQPRSASGPHQGGAGAVDGDAPLPRHAEAHRCAVLEPRRERGRPLSATPWLLP